MVKVNTITNLNKQNIPLLTFVMIIFSGFGLWFLNSKGLASASIYFTMFTFFIGILVLLQLFLKDDDTFSLITKDFKFPFVNSLLVDVSSYVIFSIFAIVVAFIPVGQGFTVNDLSVPLTSTGNIGSQVLSAVSLEQSASNRIFMTAVLPGIYESLLYNFILVFAGALVAHLIFKLLTDKDRLLGLNKTYFVTIFALIFASSAFIASHALNGSYEGIMFVKAGLFLLVTNILIYFLRIPISGIIGYHIMNNTLWLVGQFGFIPTFKGYLSIFGLIYIPFNLLLFYYFLRNSDKVGKEFGDLFRN
jgi:hypothetical protein